MKALERLPRAEDAEALDRAIVEAERISEADAAGGGGGGGFWSESLLAQDIAKARESLDKWRLQV